MLPVVLFQAPHEKRAVERLVRFCKELDGTEVRVFSTDEPQGMRYPEVANWSFRFVAEQMKGQAFIWIEADCAILKAGAFKDISNEYKRIGKEYLYAKMGDSQFDRFSGIGVQGPNAFEHAPVGYKDGGFDQWVVEKFPDKVGRTTLISHSYGSYDSRGDATLHEFPRDMHVIGEGAVIFHKDQRQQLLDVILPGRGYENSIKCVSGVGDAGDLILSLATIKHQGDQAEYYLRDNGMTKGIVSRIHLVKPLVEAQTYIEACKIWKRETIHWESEGFRPGWHNRVDSLAACHARHALDKGFISTMPDFSKPWLVAEANKSYAGRIVINRTDRYQNPYFPWGKIVAHYGKRLVFIGMPHEHSQFCSLFGQVEYKPTKDFLEVAQMIAGSSLYIGGQSSCMTIAEGLKHPRILEGSLVIPDCCYAGSHNAQYVFDGSMTLPDIDGSGELKTPQQAFKLEEFELNMVPKHKKGWGWFYKHEDKPEICESMCKNAAAKLVKQTGLSLQECKERVIRYNVSMSPAFFGRYLNLNHFQQCKNALLAAGITDNSVFKLATGAALGTI